MCFVTSMRDRPRRSSSGLEVLPGAGIPRCGKAGAEIVRSRVIVVVGLFLAGFGGHTGTTLSTVVPGVSGGRTPEPLAATGPAASADADNSGAHGAAREEVESESQQPDGMAVRRWPSDPMGLSDEVRAAIEEAKAARASWLAEQKKWAEAVQELNSRRLKQVVELRRQYRTELEALKERYREKVRAASVRARDLKVELRNHGRVLEAAKEQFLRNRGR